MQGTIHSTASVWNSHPQTRHSTWPDHLQSACWHTSVCLWLQTQRTKAAKSMHMHTQHWPISYRKPVMHAYTHWELSQGSESPQSPPPPFHHQHSPGSVCSGTVERRWRDRYDCSSQYTYFVACEQIGQLPIPKQHSYIMLPRSTSANKDTNGNKDCTTPMASSQKFTERQIWHKMIN